MRSKPGDLKEVPLKTSRISFRLEQLFPKIRPDLDRVSTTTR
jgi:hypothetical protein